MLFVFKVHQQAGKFICEYDMLMHSKIAFFDGWSSILVLSVMSIFVSVVSVSLKFFEAPVKTF